MPFLVEPKPDQDSSEFLIQDPFGVRESILPLLSVNRETGHLTGRSSMRRTQEIIAASECSGLSRGISPESIPMRARRRQGQKRSALTMRCVSASIGTAPTISSAARSDSASSLATARQSVAQPEPPAIAIQRFKTARKPAAVRYRGRLLRGARQCTDVAPPQPQ